MGGQSIATFSIKDGVGVFNGTCAIVPSLKAPGFCSAQTKAPTFGHDAFPDASSALAGGLVVEASSSTPEFQGFKVAFSAKDVPSSSIYTHPGSFKAGFNMTGTAPQKVFVPFSEFSWDWSPYTGRCDTKDPTGTQHHCCDGAGGKYCPTAAYLASITNLQIWAEGAEGNFHLEVKSVEAAAAPPAE